MISPAIKILLTVILCICLCKAKSQTTAIDSVKKVLIAQKEESENRVNTLNELVSKLLDSDSLVAALPYATEAKGIANKINYKKGKAFAYYNLARFNILKNNLTEALEFSLSALDMYTTLGNIRKTIELHNFSSYIYTKQFNLYQAINSQYQALKGYEILKDTSQIAYCTGNLAILHGAQGNNAEALQYHSAALKFYTKLKDKDGIANTYRGTGIIYNAEGKYQQALKMDSTALELFTELKDTWSIAWCLSAIAKVFETQGSENYSTGAETLATEMFQKALKNYSSALQLFKDIQSNADVVKLNSRVGNINIKLGKFNEARPYLEKSLDESLRLNDMETIQYNYKGLYKLDSLAGNYKQAFKNYSKYILYRDSVFNDESKKKTLQLKMQYDFDKKVAATQAEQQMKDAAVKRTRNLQYSVIGVFLLLAVFLYWNIQQKQKAKSKIESAYTELKSTQAQLIQSEKMASLGELTAGIAHEIQNPLNFVNNFSELNTELIEELEQEADKGNINEVKSIAADLKENEQKIKFHGKRADSIVKGMLQHSRASTGKKELIDINALTDEYLRLSYHGFRAKDKAFNATIETHFDETIGKIEVIPQDIGKVLLNLYNNAFYAVHEKAKKLGESYEPTILVSTKKLDDYIEIRVTDNGMGISKSVQDKIFQPFYTTKPAGQGTGLGLSLSYDIIKALGGELQVESVEGEGSMFLIQLSRK